MTFQVIADCFSFAGMLVALGMTVFFVTEATHTYFNPFEHDLWPLAALYAVMGVVLFLANLALYVARRSVRKG